MVEEAETGPAESIATFYDKRSALFKEFICKIRDKQSDDGT